jgi:hypothetical protein
MQEKPKYKMLQLSEETHKLLKDYCKKHGYSLSGFVNSLINRTIKAKKI